ncbi:proteasome subunit alpha type 7 [Carpediemonas membranifera]|uniref:Proteasome subunit alpha type n=1 Tax=Carpediemonas membranifera TaxID=201153 RepID=A0A8J6AQJ0_9EUKA|nr:proteasome subunit alpha type 7 [Carpediemonas membranifera]|eukprot:KAG9391093.1 proteasome subunit alpha type 7 [Carpediemonas membranifera]
MSTYDRALTVFSPDGHLFQVEYALEAVKKGACAIAAVSDDAVIIGVEKKSAAKLQDKRTVQKIYQIDDNISVAFAGLTADARVLIRKARTECQSYRLTFDEAPSISYVTRHIAGIQQKYTQSGGVRPFGISVLITGFDESGRPRVFKTDPSGTYSEWKAVVTGRNGHDVQEYLEKHYGEGENTSTDAVKTTVFNAIREMVESAEKNIEIAVVRPGKAFEFITDEELKQLNDEKNE